MFALDRTNRLPIYRQLYDRARTAIASGQLPPGERLPSTRSLAAQIGTARGTVDAAYAMLAGEGWIIARGPAGTIVAPQLAEPRGARSPARVGTRPGSSSTYSREMSLRPFRLGLPALDAFPRKLWARLVASEARALSAAGMAHPDPAGSGELRAAIVAYLAVARGISCEPWQVFVTAGYQGALGLAARAVIAAGDEVWFEDPGYYPGVAGADGRRRPPDPGADRW